jgi:lambda repressor-like predicted transcriptional regulator
MTMAPEEIKKALKARGWNMAKVGRRVRPTVSTTQVWRVVNGVDSSPRIRAAIARALDLPIEDVFDSAPASLSA